MQRAFLLDDQQLVGMLVVPARLEVAVAVVAGIAPIEAGKRTIATAVGRRAADGRSLDF